MGQELFDSIREVVTLLDKEGAQQLAEFKTGSCYFIHVPIMSLQGAKYLLDPVFPPPTTPTGPSAAGPQTTAATTSRPARVTWTQPAAEGLDGASYGASYAAELYIEDEAGPAASSHLLEVRDPSQLREHGAFSFTLFAMGHHRRWELSRIACSHTWPTP